MEQEVKLILAMSQNANMILTNAQGSRTIMDVIAISSKTQW